MHLFEMKHVGINKQSFFVKFRFVNIMLEIYEVQKLVSMNSSLIFGNITDNAYN